LVARRGRLVHALPSAIRQGITDDKIEKAAREAAREGRMSNTSSSDARPRGELTVRTIAMPADTNANGDIFGGWVMAHMDQAGGIAGVERARGRVVTVVVERMTFIRAMRVGDVLEVYTDVESVGRTSMKIHIEAWAQRFQTHDRDKVTDATFTFVHIDDEGRPQPIPAAR
jgi:acyl-CoA thioesterase YciA